MKYLGQWVSAYTFPDRWTNSSLSTAPTFLFENSLESTQVGLQNEVFSSFLIALERHHDQSPFSQQSLQLLQYIQQNRRIGVNGNQKECAPRVVVAELSFNADFVPTPRWNAKALIIERHVSIPGYFDVPREQFLVCNTHYCIFLGVDRKAHSSSGVLHLSANGRTGTVCDDGFGTNEGIAICKQLGFYYLRQYTSNEFIGESYIGNILADRFTCPRDQKEYPKCSFRLPSGYKKSKCIHKEDIWLKCETQSPPNVMNGTDHPIKGRSKMIIAHII